MTSLLWPVTFKSSTCLAMGQISSGDPFRCSCLIRQRRMCVSNDAQLDRATIALEIHLYSYQPLAEIAHGQGLRLWKIRPRHHWLCQMLGFTMRSRANPLRYACFVDEDFMGKVKGIGTACHEGTASSAAITRWLLVQAVRWERRKRRGLIPGDM